MKSQFTIILLVSVIATATASIRGLSQEESPMVSFGNENVMMTTMPQFNCTFAAEDCSHAGDCSRDRHSCICNSGYLTVDYTDKQCNYEQKKQTIGMLLTVFLSCFGAARFYVGDTTLGLVQLFCAGMACWSILGILGCCALGASKGEVSSPVLCIGCIAVMSVVTWFVWWIIDMSMFGMNTVMDGNGQPLAHW